MMKKTAVLVMVLMLTVLASAAIAGDKGESMAGRLFLFQKCDPSLAPAPVDPAVEPDPEAEPAKYDTNGCPLPGNGPWPIFPDNRRWGQMKYNLMGPEFQFSFQGKNLVPEVDYTLIYYPDPWPGLGLVCLGTGKTNAGGNLQIHGKQQFLYAAEEGQEAFPMGLPMPYDGNYLPGSDLSGAVGAKIWLVLSADVSCPSEEVGAMESTLVGWNPASYLFEGNLIIYQYAAPVVVADDAEDDADGDADVEVQEPEAAPTIAATPGNQGNNGKGNAYGKAK